MLQVCLLGGPIEASVLVVAKHGAIVAAGARSVSVLKRTNLSTLSRPATSRSAEDKALELGVVERGELVDDLRQQEL